MGSIQTILNLKHNNYGKISEAFQKKFGFDIVAGHSQKTSPKKTASIIIPFYKNHLILQRNLLALSNQNLPNDFKNNKLEAVIIQDGSIIKTNVIKRFLSRSQVPYPIHYLHLKENHGPAVAMNLGLLFARNEVVIFLDPDMMVNKNFIRSHLIRHEITEQAIIVSFRKNISRSLFYKKIKKLSKNNYCLNRPSHKEDFRYKKFTPINWQDAFINVNRDNFNKTWYPLKESCDFLNFGKGKIIGVWDLPFMLLTCNASVSRKKVIKAGGFDTRFEKNILEDTHLAAKLIASGMYLIPNLEATSYHIAHKAPQKQRRNKFKKNFQLYVKFKKENLISYTENAWKKKMKKYFKNKFEIIQ